MKISSISKESGKLRFVISDATASFVNELRRILSYEVPVLAIEEVYISENSSALYDEFLAQRLGLIPLKTDLKTYVLPQDCKCKEKGCASCQSKGTLKIKGPATVYAKDIIFKDKSITPAFPDIPIVTLIEGQQLELQVIATLGLGKDHVKFSPGHAYYQNYPSLKLGKNANKKCAEVCPTNVFDVKGDKISIARPENCILCKACEDKCGEDAVKVESEAGKFIFTFESWGQLKDNDVLKHVAKIMENKLKGLKIR